MLSWFYDNLGTILISLFLILIVAMIIRTLISDRKKGRSLCGGNCANCRMCTACRKNAK